MKNILLAIFFSSALVACSSTNDVDYWQGESLASVIQTYGTPATFLRLDDGNKILEFHHSSTIQIANNYCSLTFMVDRGNKVLGAKGQGNGKNCLG
jgi:hypothetical protein